MVTCLETADLLALLCVVFVTFQHVLIHIRTIGEVGNVKPSTPVFYFTDRSKAVLLLWILFIIYVLSVSLICCLVCSLQICHYLMGKGWPLGSLVCDVFLFFVTFQYGAMAFNFDLSESYQLTCAIRLAPVLKTFFHQCVISCTCR